MFCKLALKNVLRSLRDYLIYFITITFGVCVFYVFNSMESQTVVQWLDGVTSSYVEAIMLLIDVISAFVAVVLAFLILYANTFLIRRRKKELGTYLLLGMERRQVAGILFLETLCIGLLALGAGLALGVFLSQFISVFTAGLFSIRLEAFHFVFSAGAVGKTLLYFGVIFLLVMLFNSLSVSRHRLIDLLQAERVGQALKLKSVGASAAMFLAGAVLLGAAYTLLLRRGLLRVDRIFWLMLALGAAGTLLFFRSLSGFLLRVCQKSRALYYRGLNMFILRQFNSRINTTYVSMTVICLLLLLAIGITACSVGLNNTLEGISSGRAPYDFTLRFLPSQGSPDAPLERWLEDQGFDPDAELSGYVCAPLVRVDMAGRRLEAAGAGYTVDSLPGISLSHCNALLALQGLAPLSLGEDEYGILWGTREEDMRYAQILWAQGQALSVAGWDLTPQPAAECGAVVETGQWEYTTMLVLPDAAAAALPVDEILLSGNYAPGADPEDREARLREALIDLVPADYDPEGTGYGYMLATRLAIYMDTMGNKILVLFIGMYLGIIFLLTSAAVLALQQLSQAADNAGRYRILARLGVDRAMANRSVDVQVFLSFFLPLALACVHAAVGMTAANAVIAQVGKVDSAASSIVTAGIILVVYGAYFLATCAGSRRIARGR